MTITAPLNNNSDLCTHCGLDEDACDCRRCHDCREMHLSDALKYHDATDEYYCQGCYEVVDCPSIAEDERLGFHNA